MEREVQAQLFAFGLLMGAIGAVWVTDALVSARRARAEELRARRALVEKQLELLARVDALAAGNAAAAA